MADPNMMPPAPEGDPNAMGGEDPMAGGEEPIGDDDSTEGIISQLSDDDKEAVRNYAKSLLSRDETFGEEMDGDEPMSAPEPPQGQPAPGVMMEITKARLKKVQKRLSETLRKNVDREDSSRSPKQKKVGKNNRKKSSPFDSPNW